MEKITLKTKTDFNKAIKLIDTYNKSLTQEVKYLTKKGAEKEIEPNLTKDYTTYDNEELTIDADGKVLELLTDDGITYTSVCGCCGQKK